MDFKRGNQTRQSSHVSLGESQHNNEPRQTRTLQLNWPSVSWRKLLILGGFAAVIALAAWLVPSLLAPQKIDSGKYQVVYLVGRQAYFGKLKNTAGDYIYVQDPYMVQETKQADADKKDAAEQQTQTAIIKVSKQLYGPEDSIAIKSNQVLFWQNLRDDSKVAQAIKQKTDK